MNANWPNGHRVSDCSRMAAKSPVLVNNFRIEKVLTENNHQRQDSDHQIPCVVGSALGLVAFAPHSVTKGDAKALGLMALGHHFVPAEAQKP